jgi:hypothetical protein
VTPAAPTVTWANPAGIASGTPLSSTRLDATANVPGTFTDSPAAGTVLGVGNNQVLSATFVPTDSTDSKGASATATLNVLPGSLGVQPRCCPPIEGLRRWAWPIRSMVPALTRIAWARRSIARNSACRGEMRSEEVFAETIRGRRGAEWPGSHDGPL